MKYIFIEFWMFLFFQSLNYQFQLLTFFTNYFFAISKWNFIVFKSEQKSSGLNLIQFNFSKRKLFLPCLIFFSTKIINPENPNETQNTNFHPTISFYSTKIFKHRTHLTKLITKNINLPTPNFLSPIPIPFKVEPKLKNVIMKLAPEPSFIRILPFPINNFESNVLIGRASMEPQNGKILIIRTRSQVIFRRCVLVDQIWIEDIELVSLYDLGWRVVHVVMCLIVFVPLESRVNPVEIPRFPRSILVRPQINLRLQRRLHTELRLVLVHVLLSLPPHRLFLHSQNILHLPSSAQNLVPRKFQPLKIVFFENNYGSRFQVGLRHVFWRVTATFVLVERFRQHLVCCRIFFFYFVFFGLLWRFWILLDGALTRVFKFFWNTLLISQDLEFLFEVFLVTVAEPSPGHVGFQLGEKTLPVTDVYTLLLTPADFLLETDTELFQLDGGFSFEDWSYVFCHWFVDAFTTTYCYFVFGSGNSKIGIVN